MNYHDVSAAQTGAIGEALVRDHAGYATELIETWLTGAAADIDRIADEDTVHVEHDHRVETYYINHEGEHRSWTPDCLFTARLRRSFGGLESSDTRRLDLPVEVKTGAYAELERNQRQVMELVATECDVVPLLAAVDLDPLPDAFGLEVRTIEPSDPED